MVLQAVGQACLPTPCSDWGKNQKEVSSRKYGLGWVRRLEETSLHGRGVGNVFVGTGESGR